MSYVLNGLVLWPVLPNWGAGITESLEFRTRVLGPTLTGVRQKRRMRKAPRRSFNFEVHPHHDSRRLLDNLRFSQGKREWALPIWHDRQALSATLAAGATVIPCATTGYDFYVGGIAVLRTNTIFNTTFEFVTIASIAANQITLTAPTVNEWAKGTHLFPIRVARFAERSSVTLLTGQVSKMSVDMDVSEPCDWTAQLPAATYLGMPVWEYETDWRSGRNYSFDRVIDTIDNDTATPVYYDFSDKTFASLDAQWRAVGRAQHTEMRGILYGLAGRYKSLWVPTLAHDLLPAGTMGAASVTLPVAYSGYALFGLNKHGRRDIRIELTSGAIYYRRITNAVQAGAIENLTLSASLGLEVSAANISRISFMMLMQQASDSTTITHHTDAAGISTLPITFEGITETPL